MLQRERGFARLVAPGNKPGGEASARDNGTPGGSAGTNVEATPPGNYDTECKSGS